LGRGVTGRATADAARGHRDGDALRHPGPGLGGGDHGLRHRDLHVVRGPGGGGGRHHPHGARLRGRAGVPGGAGAVRRRRNGPLRRPGRPGVEGAGRGGPGPRGRMTGWAAVVAAGAETVTEGTAMIPDLRVRLGEWELANPVMTAAGCAGSGRELARFCDISRIGAVVTKSVTVEPRAGRPAPRIAETPSGV